MLSAAGVLTKLTSDALIRSLRFAPGDPAWPGTMMLPPLTEKVVRPKEPSIAAICASIVTDALGARVPRQHLWPRFEVVI